MKLAVKAILFPLVLFFIAFIIVEIIYFIFIILIYQKPLNKNNNEIKKLLIENTKELDNSINYLIIKEIHTIFKYMILFKQHMNMLKNYYNESSIHFKYNLISECLANDTEDLEDIKDIESLYQKYFKVKSEDTLEDKIKMMFNEDFLDLISYYSPSDIFDEKYDYSKISRLICYAMSFFKSLEIKNIINNEHNNILNYTILSDNFIFVYPYRKLDKEIIKSIPYYDKQNSSCIRREYDFQCFQILKYFKIHFQKSLNQGFNEYNSLIIFPTHVSDDMVITNFCTAINNDPYDQTNLEEDFLYADEYKENNKNLPHFNYLCVTYNMAPLMSQLYLNTKDLTYNLVILDTEQNLRIMFTSNDDINKQILDPLKNKYFSSKAYGKYTINEESNAYQLFHSIYYDIENNYKLTDEQKKELVKEYDNNAKILKEKMTEIFLQSSNTSSFVEVNQTFLLYGFDNKGKKTNAKVKLKKTNFYYYFRQISTLSSQMLKGYNLMDLSKRQNLYISITVVKQTQPYKTGDIYEVFIFSCVRNLLFDLALSLVGIVVVYISSFFFMISTLSPLKRFKKNIQKLISKVNRKDKKNSNNDDNDYNSLNIENKQNDSFDNDNNPFQTNMNYNNNDNNFYENEKKDTKNNNYIDDINNIITPNNNNKNNNNQIFPLKLSRFLYRRLDPKLFIHKLMNFNIKFGNQFTNYEMREIEEVIIFLQKILLLKSKAPYRAKAEFYKSISKEIPKSFEAQLFKCQLIVGKLYIKDSQYHKAKVQLESLLHKIELKIQQISDENKNNENLNIYLSSYYGTYINEFSELDMINEKEFIQFQLLLESANYLLGICNYFIFKQLKKRQKSLIQLQEDIINAENQQINNKDNKKNGNNPIDNINNEYTNIQNSDDRFADIDMKTGEKINNTNNINFANNDIDAKLDYYLDNAIVHFKASEKINTHYQINFIKNISALVYLSKCYMNISSRSISESNECLKKSFETLSKFNLLLRDLTQKIEDRKISVNETVANKNTICYTDTRVMLIINSSMFQFIFYQIGKMALKTNKYRTAYFSMSRLLQLGFYKNSNLEFHAFKWLFKMSKILYNKEHNSQLKKKLGENKKTNIKRFIRLQSNTIYSDLSDKDKEEETIPKTAIDHMKNYLNELLKLYKNNPYKRKEKKMIMDILNDLNKRLIFQKKSTIKKGNYTNRRYKNEDKSNISFGFHHGFPLENNEEDNIKYIEVIWKDKYMQIINPYTKKDLSICQILYSPITLNKVDSIFYRLNKMYQRLKVGYAPKKLIYFIVTESFTNNRNTLNAVSVLMKDCLSKYLNPDDRVGLIFYSMLSEENCIFSELKNVGENSDLFGILRSYDHIYNDNYNSNDKKNKIKYAKIDKETVKKNERYITKAFDKALELFNIFLKNELRDSISEADYYDKYVFCFGKLEDLRYKDPEFSRAQKNKFNLMHISLFYFAFESPISDSVILTHYRKYFNKFVEGILIFVQSFKLIKLCFKNITDFTKNKFHLNTDISTVDNVL